MADERPDFREASEAQALSSRLASGTQGCLYRTAEGSASIRKEANCGSGKKNFGERIEEDRGSELALTVARAVVNPAHGLLLSVTASFRGAAVGLAVQGQGDLLHRGEAMFVKDVRPKHVERDLFDAAQKAATAIYETFVVGIHGLIFRVRLAAGCASQA